MYIGVPPAMPSPTAATAAHSHRPSGPADGIPAAEPVQCMPSIDRPHIGESRIVQASWKSDLPVLIFTVPMNA